MVTLLIKGGKRVGIMDAVEPGWSCGKDGGVMRWASSVGGIARTGRWNGIRPIARHPYAVT